MTEANDALIESMQHHSIQSILIVGGGTAGWLTAAILAKDSTGKNKDKSKRKIRLIEAPDVPIVGVGEGTWPSMRATLRAAGIKESDFMRECDASYKQGSKFVGWTTGKDDDFYYHPFDLPQDFYDVNLAQHWINSKPRMSFSKFVCTQEHLCEGDLSPKLKSTSDYAGVANYGYHLNAGKFSEFLKRHCTEHLDVELVRDRVIGVENNKVGECAGDISHVVTANSGNLRADLFIDCTGFRSLLLGRHYGIDFNDKSAEFPINSALAVQIPYQANEPVRSATISTAQRAGWIWDIGLSTRRGVGHVYSNAHMDKSQALQSLQQYTGLNDTEFEQLTTKEISISPGYRKTFWHRNCVAIGLSAGFLEPLEASAMVLIETSANMVADLMPSNRAAMDVVAKRFNRRHLYRWQRIIDFLKLHYALSQRQEPFWRDAADVAYLSDRLQEDLALWKHQAPWKAEFDSLEEAFPTASYQYVLYGMGFVTQATNRDSDSALISLERVAQQARLLSSKVESNRTILDLINTDHQG